MRTFTVITSVLIQAFTVVAVFSVVARAPVLARLAFTFVDIWSKMNQVSPFKNIVVIKIGLVGINW